MIIDCPNLAVPPTIMQHVMKVESSKNPYAIGVVGGRLARQPQTLAEAVATAKMLEQQGFNFSVGLVQVNRYNLQKYGITSYEQAFDRCANIRAGSLVLRECYDRAKDWPKSFSCYYSGNFTTGFEHGYVQKVVNSIQQAQMGPTPEGAIPVIPRKGFTPNAAQRGRGGATFLPPGMPGASRSTGSSASVGGAPPVIRSGTLPYGAHPKDRNARIALPPGYRAMPAPAMYGAPVGGVGGAGGYVPPPALGHAQPNTNVYGNNTAAPPPAAQVLNPEPIADENADPFKPSAKRASAATLKPATKLAENPKPNDRSRNGGLVIRGGGDSAQAKPVEDNPINLNSDSGKKDNALIF